MAVMKVVQFASAFSDFDYEKLVQEVGEGRLEYLGEKRTFRVRGSQEDIDTLAANLGFKPEEVGSQSDKDIREWIVQRAQKYIQHNYARGKFNEDEGKSMRDAIIHNLVAFIIQDIEMHYELKQKELVG